MRSPHDHEDDLDEYDDEYDDYDDEYEEEYDEDFDEEEDWALPSGSLDGRGRKARPTSPTPPLHPSGLPGPGCCSAGGSCRGPALSGPHPARPCLTVLAHREALRLLTLPRLAGQGPESLRRPAPPAKEGRPPPGERLPLR